MFRSILTKDENKWNFDMGLLWKLLVRLEENLMLSKSDYFFSSTYPSMVDFYFVPHVLRLFYLAESKTLLSSSVFSDWLEFMKVFKFIKRWAFNLLDNFEDSLASKESFLAMIKEFQVSGKWGLYLPLAKL